MADRNYLRTKKTRHDNVKHKSWDWHRRRRQRYLPPKAADAAASVEAANATAV